MEIVKLANQDSIIRLGGEQQRTKGKKYRLNKFCLQTEVEEGTLIYNGLSGALVMIKPVELMNIFTEDPCDYVDFLIANWFLVPENYNEDEILDIIKNNKKIPLTDTYLDHPSSFTIFTTTTCNARCFYCYELKTKGKTPMSMETAEKVAKYIVNCAPKNQEVVLDWFGGEPLFNKDVITLITSRVRSAGFNVRGTMVSNGYLFDDKLIKTAKKDWSLSNVQITLDGTEEVYNKTKNYIYKDCESPFKRIIENIHKLSENDINVSIRMNCDKHNYEDLLKLVDYLGEEFKNNKNISLYVWQIFEEGFTRNEEDKKALCESLTKIEQAIYDKGYDVGHGLNSEINANHCMADRGNAVCIYPNGEIGVCEHYLDSKFVSTVEDPNNKNWEVLRNWRHYIPHTEICSDCPLKPLCLKLEGCTDENICDQYFKEYQLKHYKICLETEWSNYKNNIETGCNSCNPNCPTHLPNCMEHAAPDNSGNWQRVMSDGTIIPIKTYQ